MKFSFYTSLLPGTAVLALAVLALSGQASFAQSLSDFVSEYNKPTKMQHMSIDDEPTSGGMNYFTIEGEPDKEAADKAVEVTKEVDKKTTYLPKSSAVIIAPDAAPVDPKNAPKEFVYQSNGLILEDSERFPDMHGLTQWPWLKELTYGLENAATQNALQILDRDLSKASPLAIIWAAQHYYDAGQHDKALFLYLGSRLRSAVDQARFTEVKKDDVSASKENIDTERSVGMGTGKERSAYKSLSSYNAIASSIGRPILRYGLRNPQQYKSQLNSAMLWDAETPYEYVPSVNDLEISEDGKDSWSGSYHKIRKVYHKQMMKIIQITSK